MTFSPKYDVTRKRVTILGMARSGVAAALLLKERGATPFVSDSAGPEKLTESLKILKESGIGHETSSHSGKVFDADFLVVSPGIPSSAPVVKEALRRGLKIYSELEISSWFCGAPMIAITGTNGKTTTTTLTGKIFEQAGREVFTGGNIGNAFSNFASKLSGDGIAVLEVSSFQLDNIESFHPRVSVLLNITPDHLDRYGNDFQTYTDSKCRIFENQSGEDYLVYNHDDPRTRAAVETRGGLKVRKFPFALKPDFPEGVFLEDGWVSIVLRGKKTRIVKGDEIRIKGIHNLYNSMAAAASSHLMGVGAGEIRGTLLSFPGVEHRLELVRELEGVTYINDSKATNVDSVWYALNSYDRPVIILIGGRDKGNDYGKLDEPVRKNVKAIIAIGESAPKVREAFSRMKKVVVANSMPEAVKEARKIASSGDIILLSPACASFDWFENYEHRGKVFKEIVNGLNLKR